MTALSLPVPIVRARGYNGETQGLIMGGWPTHVVVMRGAHTDSHGWTRLEFLLTEASLPSTHLVLRFDDTSDASDHRAPKEEHIQLLLRFVGLIQGDDRLLVLCPGGYGRSTAAACIARVTWGAQPVAAMQETVADRPRATPNRLMIARADALLGYQGRLWRAYADWASLALGLRYEPPVPLQPGPKRRRGLRRGRK